MKTQILTVLATGALLASGSANAALSACDAATAGKVTVLDTSARSGGCEFLVGGGNGGLTLINSEAFFGFNDWLLDSKDDDLDGNDEGLNLLGVSFDGDLQSGTFSFSGDLTGKQVMMVFKGASFNAVPSSLIGYMLDTAFSSGTYAAASLTPTGTPHDISHASVYFRNFSDIDQEVPLPGAVWLMGAGLAALRLSRRKLTRA